MKPILLDTQNQSVMSKYYFFFLVAVLLTFFGQWGQTSVVTFYDNVAIREAGFNLATSDDPVTNIKRLYWGALTHRYGPIQFVFQNICYWFLGKWLPMLPSTMQIPNIVILLGAGWMAWKVGEALQLGRYSWLIPATLLLQGVVLPASRTLSYGFLAIFVQLCILYFIIKLTQTPNSLFHKMALPSLIGLYPLISTDWPLFLLVVGLMVLCINNRKAILFNIFNIIIVGFIVFYCVVLYNYLFSGTHYFPIIFLPFSKLSGIASGHIQTRDTGTYIYILWSAFYGFGFLALANIWIPFRFIREKLSNTPVKSSPDNEKEWTIHILPNAGLITAIFVWYLVIVTMTMRLNTVWYGAYGIVPIAILSAFVLKRTGKTLMVSFLLVNMIHHMEFVFSPALPGTPFSTTTEDLRVLAISGFINQNRPDLLTENKTAFLPNYLTASAGYHIRGRQKRIVMPNYFPEFRGRFNIPSDGGFQRSFLGDRVGSPDYILNNFMDTYLNTGKLSADWLLIIPEHTEGSSGWFFNKLLNDPQIDWIAELHDSAGRKIWLGEKSLHGRTVAHAPKYQVKEFAKLYVNHYLNIDFMSKDWGYFRHM
ncbi:MAG: hypothetical protein HQL55_17270 [Magnetococcales bacterium]|nr:hypothetical protein [Magnetococcales bacterium]